MTQDMYEVFPIPVPFTATHVRNYATLRLLALQTDPQCFGSTYERESAFTDAVWRSRLDSDDKVTIIASSLPSQSESGDEGGWVGTVTILAPAMLFLSGFALPKSVTERGVDIYQLVGMWIHPEHRKRGLGKRLIEAGLDWIRRERTNDRGVPGEMVLMLKVVHHNNSAKSLYTSMGFVETDDEVEMGGGISMIMHISK